MKTRPKPSRAKIKSCFVSSTQGKLWGNVNFKELRHPCSYSIVDSCILHGHFWVHFTHSLWACLDIPGFSLCSPQHFGLHSYIFTHCLLRDTCLLLNLAFCIPIKRILRRWHEDLPPAQEVARCLGNLALEISKCLDGWALWITS